MKTKQLITLITGMLTVIFLIINLTYAKNPTIDKWTSFGLGITSVFFIGEGLLLIKGRKNNTETNPN